MKFSFHRTAGTLAALALTAGIVTGVGQVAAPADAASYSVTGIDVSAYQHPNGAAINWSTVAQTEEFAIVKATEGLTGNFDNAWFGRDVDGAKAAGLVVGTYHFADPGTPVVDDAAGEARHYWDVIKSRQGAGVLPPALDVEKDNGLTQAELRSWIGTFMTELKRLSGKTPILYTYPSFWENEVATDSYAGYPLWIANYGVSSPQIPGGWSNWKIWQYTSSATVSGVPDSTIDRNYFNGTLAQLREFANGGVAVPVRNGVCESGEFCYFFNSDNAGSMSDHAASQADYGATLPSCYVFKSAGAGQGVCVKNNAASVWNRTGRTVRVHFNSSYGGAYQSIAAGAKVNLNATLKNQNASHRAV